MATTTPLETPIVRPMGERSVYTGAAIIALLAILAGFAPSYYLKGLYGTPELNTLKHVHGIVMTAWFALFLVQVRLVATGNTPLHRKLGVIGAVLAALVVILGMQTGIASARAGATPVATIPPLVFLVMPVGEMVIFTTLVTAAIVLRKKSAWHKRFMLIASLAILTPAMARLPFDFVSKGGPPVFFALTDLLILGCMAFDWRKNGRVHPAYIVGLMVVIVGQLGRLAIAGTSQWLGFAKWLTA